MSADPHPGAIAPPAAAPAPTSTGARLGGEQHAAPEPTTNGTALSHQLAPEQSANPFRHWLLSVNAALSVFLLGALAAPTFAAFGRQSVADWLYAVYHFTCHQWAFRSFFLFGAGGAPVAVYDRSQLAASTNDPYGFIGDADLGWKMAFCERDLAIYFGLLAVGILYARHRAMRPASFTSYIVLILPMAVDGFTQLFGWRESTWQLRLATGLLFGLASAWLVLPRLDASFGLQPVASQYAPGAECEPHKRVAQPWMKPWTKLSPRR